MRGIRGWLPLAVAACIAAVLSACGGGGGGGGESSVSPPASPAPAPPPSTDPPPETPPSTETFSLSGSILPSSAQQVDGDTNDPANPLRDNNSAASAQRLGNPVTVGGYVNLPGEGAEGQLRDRGDAEDFFRVDLFEGQIVTLLVADFLDADADLYLYDNRGDLLDFSLSTRELETIVVPADGEYVLNVSAFSGATNYSLSIGSAGFLEDAALAELQARQQIIPGEAVVAYHREHSQERVKAARGALRERLGLRSLAGARGRAELLGLDSSAAVAQASRFGAQAHRRQQIKDVAHRVRWETLISIKQLAQDPAVAQASPNYRLRTLSIPNDEYYQLQWHYPLIELPAAWDISTGSAEVVVAVIDTGVLSGHPDLRGQLVPGFDFVRDPASAGDGDGIDPNPEELRNPTDPTADNFHGTHVIGTVAARANNRIGVAGVAPGVRVMPLRALGRGGEGTSYDVLQAVRFAAGLDNDSGTVPAQRADIINLSLGGGGYSAVAEALYAQLRTLGITVVAAAGNEGSRAPSFPAAYDSVISVSAVDAQRRLTDYSNRGSSIAVAAPGGDSGEDLTGDGYPDGVLSTAAAEGEFAYVFVSGTSMASPHVAGVIALMKSINPGLSAADMDNLLRSGELSDDLGAPGRDDSFGYGLINARKAAEAALARIGQPIPEAPRVRTSANTLNFGSSRDTLELVISGSGGAQVLGVNSTVSWATARAQQTDAAGLGSYEISIERSALPAGVASGQIEVRASSNTLRVQLLANTAGTGRNDLGTVYVLLYDPAADEVVAQTATRLGTDGSYVFNLPPVATGSYQVVAGTDLDNDLTICDAGEACGALLTVEQPLLIRVDADRDDIVFPLEYQIAIPNIAAEAQPAVVSPLALPRP